MMLKKQRLTIIISVIAVIALAVVYFTVVSPMLSTNETDKNKNPNRTDPSEMIEGESYSDNYGKIMIFPAVEKEDIREIKIHNQHGDFGFYTDSNGEFRMTGYQATPLNNAPMGSLIASVRLPMAIKRVTTDISDLDKYGLGEDASYYILTDAKGNRNKVFIGDIIPTGGGYYAKPEDRDAVYVLDSTTQYILSPPEAFVTPILTLPTSAQDYYMIELFTLAVDSEPFVSIAFMDEDERIKTASTTYYKMLHPADYVPSTANYDEILKTFQAFEGSSVLAFGDMSEAMTPEELEPYGLKEPKYEIYYKYQGIDNYVMVSEQLEDGTYNAYSLMFNLVANVSADTMKFLNWDFIDFVSKPMFQKNINDIESIQIIGKDIDETFTVTGKDASLAITPKSTLTPLTPDGVVSFKHLYIKLLSLSLEDYTESDSTDEWLMTFKVKTRGGIETEYSFYSYSTRRCYYTINGEGEFYVLRDRVERILSDTALLMSGGTITSEMG